MPCEAVKVTGKFLGFWCPGVPPVCLQVEDHVSIGSRRSKQIALLSMPLQAVLRGVRAPGARTSAKVQEEITGGTPGYRCLDVSSASAVRGRVVRKNGARTSRPQRDSPRTPAYQPNDVATTREKCYLGGKRRLFRDSRMNPCLAFLYSH